MGAVFFDFADGPVILRKRPSFYDRWLVRWANGGVARPRTRIRHAGRQWRAGSRNIPTKSGAM